MLYTPAYIFSLILFIILLYICIYFLYISIQYIITYISKSKKYTHKYNDDYENINQLDFNSNIDSYNTAIKVSLNNKNKEIFQRDSNKALKDLLAFKFDNNVNRIDKQYNKIDLTGINNSEIKALNSLKTKININSIDPNYDDYNNYDTSNKEHSMSIITNLMNPNYYFTNPLNKINNQDILKIDMSKDINLNQIITEKINTIIDKRFPKE